MTRKGITLSVSIVNLTEGLKTMDVAEEILLPLWVTKPDHKCVKNVQEPQ